MDETLKRRRHVNAASSAAALLCLLLFQQTAGAVNAEDDWKAALDAYSASEWKKAGEIWLGMENRGLASPQLYYNIGNCYFRQDSLGKAILYYERALKLDPTYKDAAFNLEFANTRIADSVDSLPQFFLVSWFASIRRLLTADGWAVLCLVLLSIFAAAMLVLLLSSRTSLRRRAFLSAIPALVLSMVCLAFAARSRQYSFKRESAIVIVGSSACKSSPSAEAPDIFAVHEGTKLKVLETVGEWSSIELPDGRKAWIDNKSIEFVCF